jgi:hypothetical protein
MALAAVIAFNTESFPAMVQAWLIPLRISEACTLVKRRTPTA